MKQDKDRRNALLLGGGVLLLFAFTLRKRNNFDLNEFTVSETAQRLNILSQWNPPQQDIYNGMQFFEMWVSPLKKIFGSDLKINSWWRSGDLNEEIGGVWDSEHLEGLAIDMTLIIDGVRRNDLLYQKILELQSMGRPFNQLILEQPPMRNPQHIHLSYNMLFNEGEKLYYDGQQYHTVN